MNREELQREAADCERVAALYAGWAAEDRESGHHERAAFNERRSRAWGHDAAVYRAHAEQQVHSEDTP